MSTTITIYCPACRQWHESATLPAWQPPVEGEDPKVAKVLCGCGYEAVVTDISMRSWVQTAEGDKPASEHVPAAGYPDNSQTRQLTIMRQRAEFEAEQATATARAKVVALATSVLAVATEKSVKDLLAEKVPEAKTAAAAVKP